MGQVYFSMMWQVGTDVPAAHKIKKLPHEKLSQRAFTGAAIILQHKQFQKSPGNVPAIDPLM